MRRNRINPRPGLRRLSRHHREQGIVIAIVAAFMLVVIGAMMALSIDVVTFYTARSETQLAADAAALAGARVLANSGATSDTSLSSMPAAWALAATVAAQVAEQNTVGGTKVTASEVTIPAAPVGTNTNPTFTVTIRINNLPTYFARMLGVTSVAVAASATAEAYNPSPLQGNSGIPVAPICVKPWLLPNIDPTQTSATVPIFTASSGAIQATTILGKSWPNNPGGNPDGLYSLCNPNCNGAIPGPSPGGYYPVAMDSSGPAVTGDFPVPTQVPPSCTSGFNSYQLAVAGCVPLPISCGAVASASTAVINAINIDTTVYVPTTINRNRDTVDAAECLIHQTTNSPGESDSIDTAATTPPFQFLAGTQNPVTNAAGKDVMVSDSIVTLPVINYPGTSPAPTVGAPAVNVIGFLQVFLNSSATTTLPYGTGIAGLKSQHEIPATIINMVGCGTSSTGQPILGNGASPVAVRLISPP